MAVHTQSISVKVPAISDPDNVPVEAFQLMKKLP